MKKNKKTQEQRDSLIAQSNDLAKARYNYSLWEFRIFVEMLQTIKEDDKEFKKVRLYYSDFAKVYQSDGRNDYRRITKAIKALGRKIMFVPYIDPETKEEREFSDWIIKVDIPKHIDDGHKKYADLIFNDGLKPLLLELSANYFLYDKINILKIKGKYTFVFYQFFKAIEREDRDKMVVTLTIKKIRAMILVDPEGNPTNQYERLSDLERYLIKPVQKELKEKTDIRITYEKVKEGKKVKALCFTLYKNRKNRPKEQQFKSIKIQQETTKQQPRPKAPKRQPSTVKTPSSDDPIHNNQAYQKLIKVGVSSKKAVELTKEYDLDYLVRSIQRAIEANTASPKNNLAGFIIKCIKDGTYKAVIAKQQKKRQKARTYQQKLEVHLKIVGIKNEYESARTEYLKEIKKTLDEKTTKEIVKIARKSFTRAAEMMEEKVRDSVYFGFAIVDFYDEQGAFRKEYTSFENYLKLRYLLKVSTDNPNGWYEIVK